MEELLGKKVSIRIAKKRYNCIISDVMIRNIHFERESEGMYVEVHLQYNDKKSKWKKHNLENELFWDVSLSELEAPK